MWHNSIGIRIFWVMFANAAILISSVLAVLVSAATPNEAKTLKTSRQFDTLPTPVQSYAIQLGVESGLDAPADLSIDKDANFLIGVPNSDINLDGKIDYFAAACQFVPKEAEAAYITNGNPCAYSVLIISQNGEGYEFVEASGILIHAQQAEQPIVRIAERNFGDCGEETYMCDNEYKVEADDHGGFKLKLIKSRPSE